MSAVDFLQAHVRDTIHSNTFMGADTNKKVLPECSTPNVSDIKYAAISPEEKTDAVLSDPKFGMFSLFHYHWTRGYKNTAMKKRNTVFCSHIFSLLFALPLLVFLTQWLMFFATVANQIRSYDKGICPNQAALEEKMMMSAVSIFYFIQSFFLWDNIVDRTHRKKMIPSTSYIVMLDTFQEFGFNLFVYIMNLWIIFAEEDFLDMFFNTLAMEFLMEMDNEFERAYFTYLPGVAADIYDNMFVTYAENAILMRTKHHDSRCFRASRWCTWLPFKILIFMFIALPFVCFTFIFYGGICK